jgi:protein ImuA
MDMAIENKQKNDVFAALKDRIRQIERNGGSGAPGTGKVLPLLPAIDRLWSEGGLPLGCLHEVRGDGRAAGFSAVTAFGAALAGRLSRTSGAVLWCGRFGGLDVYGPGLAQVGLNPSQLILASATTDADILAVMEEGLRHPVLACVIGEVGRIALTASRRLQLAAEKSGVTAFVLRTPQRKPVEASAEPLTAAGRWQITVLPSAPHEIPEAGRARWQLELLQSRGGAVGQWNVEAPDAQGHLRLSSSMADGRAAAPPAAQRRLAG